MAVRVCSPPGAAGPGQQQPASTGERVMKKKEQIEVGGTYLAKVGARSVEVRVDGEHPKGGWNATAVGSGKPVRVKDAKHLRPAKAANESDPVAPTSGTKAAKRTPKKRAGAKGKAAGESKEKRAKAP